MLIAPSNDTKKRTTCIQKNELAYMIIELFEEVCQGKNDLAKLSNGSAHPLYRKI